MNLKKNYRGRPPSYKAAAYRNAPMPQPIMRGGDDAEAAKKPKPITHAPPPQPIERPRNMPNPMAKLWTDNSNPRR